MRLNTEKDPLFSGLKPVINRMGFEIVELISKSIQGRLHLYLVVYKEEGVNLEDCSVIYKTVLPRIELLNDNRDIRLEVSSPGLTRKIKTADEFAVFINKGVVLLLNTGDKIAGVIESSNNEGLKLKIGNKMMKIDYNEISTAKLDYTQEVG